MEVRRPHLFSRLIALFTANLDLKVLSFLLALMLWKYVAMQNPKETRKFQVPVFVKNLSSEYLLAEPQQASVFVWVEGPVEKLNRLRTEEILISADAKKAIPKIEDTGEYEFPVEIDSFPADLVLRNFPPSLRLKIDKVSEKEMEVEFRLQTPFPENVELQQVSVEPDKVRVRGSATDVARATRAVVNFIPAHFEKSEVFSRVPVLILDNSSKPIENLEVIPPDVGVWLSTALRKVERFAVVKPRILGEPAPGYYIEAIRVEPQMVLISGPPEKLPSEPQVETLPIDITQSKQTVKKTNLALVYPEQRFRVRPSEVSVSVEIRPIRGEIILEVPVLASAPEGWQASVSPPEVKITFFGYLVDFKNIKSEDVKAIAQIRSPTETSFVTRVQVIYPEKLQLIRVSPEEVTVSLSRK
ncbi:MAG: CdaR family protein [bacterium JZ-2024 1]